jgi:type VI secretion system secreted protein Hcp
MPGETKVDYFLKVDGIPGESADAKHKDEIDVLAFSWGVSQSGGPVPGGGAGAGKADFEDLLVVARTSKASPLLWQACASGQHIKSAVLTCRRGGRASIEFLKIALEDVLVASYELDGSDDEPPLDQIALAYAKIETEYTPVDKTGKPQPVVKAGWNLKANKKV